jgi:hypothetical protein
MTCISHVIDRNRSYPGNSPTVISAELVVQHFAVSLMSKCLKEYISEVHVQVKSIIDPEWRRTSLQSPQLFLPVISSSSIASLKYCA